MKKISKIAFLKHKKELQELYKMGRQYDREKDPEKKAVLEKEIISRCDVLKEKLNLKDCSDDESNALLGVSVNPASEKPLSEESLETAKCDADTSN